MSRWSAYVAERLDALGRGEGDFTGLKQPSQDTLRYASYVAVTTFLPTTPTPSVVPGEDGEVIFVWKKAGWDLEIAVLHAEANVWASREKPAALHIGSLHELKALVLMILGDMGG